VSTHPVSRSPMPNGRSVRELAQTDCRFARYRERPVRGTLGTLGGVVFRGLRGRVVEGRYVVVRIVSHAWAVSA
jgi:hypothetical protein